MEQKKNLSSKKLDKKRKNPKLSIIIPVFNEGENLKILLRLLPPMIGSSYEILIAHDIPNDDSIPVVRSFQKTNPSIRLVHNMIGRGVINAVRAGIKEAKGEYALIIAADDIGPILSIEDMIALMDEGCDLVNATRYAHGGKNIGGVFIGSVLSTIANKIFHILTGSSLTDPTFGVKMFRRELFDTIVLESKPIGWAFSLEFAIKAQLKGWKIGEVPLISLNRLYAGKSSFRFGPWIREYIRWFFWGMIRLRTSKAKKVAIIRIPKKLRSN